MKKVADSQHSVSDVDGVSVDAMCFTTEGNVLQVLKN